MAKSRTFKSNLTRLVGETSSLVYVLAEDGDIAFANSACLTWLGLEESELKGRRCVYSSQPQKDPVDEKLRGIAIAPNLFESTIPDTISIFRIDSKGNPKWRNCTVNTIHSSDETELLMIVTNAPETNRPDGKDTDPFDANRLHQALVQLNAEMRHDDDLQSLVGESAVASQIAKRIELAVASNAATVITGPQGSGREHIAKVIHSSRHDHADQPGRLIPLHCKIADQHLVQENIRELFSDSFGSLKSNREDSEDCLLLLDIEKLSLESQHELFGFLSMPNISISTISTCSEPVQQLSVGGQFHSELAQLISTIEINVPPLRDRKQDIPLVARAILDRDNRRRKRNKAGFTSQAMKLLVEFNWPGNIDQLERCVLAASDAAVTTMIKAKELPEEFHNSISAQRIGRPLDNEIKLDDYLQTIEHELIARAMSQAKGTKSRAAKLLGISRSRLIRRLGQLGFTENSDDAKSDSETTIDSSAFQETDE